MGPLAVPAVSFRHLSEGLCKRNLGLSPLLQLGVTPSSPFFDRGVEKYLEIRIRKNNRSDIAPLKNGRAGPSKPTLQPEEGTADLRLSRDL